jgi:hypothetical protein
MTVFGALADDETPEIITIRCVQPGCDWTAETAPNRENWRRGQHERNVHGIVGKGRQPRKRKGMPTEADKAARPVISAAREVAAEIGSGSGRAPSADKLAEGLGRGVEMAIGGVAVVIVESEPDITRDERDRLVGYLSLSPEASVALARPFARLFAGTKLNARYGRQVVDNVDVVGALVEVVQLGIHWREFMALRRQQAMIRAQGGLYAVPGPTDMAPAPGVMQPPTPTTTEANGFVHTSAPTEGRVLSAEDVARMRGGQ